MGEIGDRVPGIPGGKVKNVGAGTALQQVVAGRTVEEIAPRIAKKRVVAAKAV